MRFTISAAVFLAAVSSAALAQPVVKPACDSACLKSFVDRYLDAMLTNDPSPALFARGTKFTENGVQLPLGNEGLWYGMSGKGTYKFYVPDVETEQIAFIGTARENAATAGANTGDGTPVAIALRLKIAGGLITQVEQLVIRPQTTLGGGNGNASGNGSGNANGANGGTGRGAGSSNGSGASSNASSNGSGGNAPGGFPPAGAAIERVGAPNPIYSEVIPESERPSREALIETANYYFTGLQRNDGKGYYPFTDDCDRLENGIQTTNIPRTDPRTGVTTKMGCKEQFEKSLKGIVSRIRDRRFVAVDRDHGIVFAFAFFDHERINWTWQLAELFKIEHGKIRRIEAVLQRVPYGMNSGWSTYEQGISEEIQSIR